MPTVGLEDIISNIEALIEFTERALNDSNQAISPLNSEVSMMRKAVLQNCMAMISTQHLRGPVL